MLIEMRTRGSKLGLVSLLLVACSNDQFTGEDAAADVEAGAPEAAAIDVVEASEIEAGPTTFCATQPSAFFCDDFETLPNPTESFSVTTPAQPTAGTFAFGQGYKSDKGLAVKAGAASTAYVTKQNQSNALHGFTFAIQITTGAIGVVYARVQAQSSSFTLQADVTGANIGIKGDTGSAQNVITADGNWHVFDVALVNGNASVAIDGKAPVMVPFVAEGSWTSTVDVGIVSPATLGAGVAFDDVALR
jgi:hypothetical protein